MELLSFFLFCSTSLVIFQTSFERKNDENLLAVMAWIYGGIFVFGSTSSSVYGPDFLIADNVVIVTIGFRVGALGK